MVKNLYQNVKECCWSTVKRRGFRTTLKYFWCNKTRSHTELAEHGYNRVGVLFNPWLRVGTGSPRRILFFSGLKGTQLYFKMQGAVRKVHISYYACTGSASASRQCFTSSMYPSTYLSQPRISSISLMSIKLCLGLRVIIWLLPLKHKSIQTLETCENWTLRP